MIWRNQSNHSIYFHQVEVLTIHPIQINELKLGGNKNMGPAGLSEVGKMMNECSIGKLNLWGCNLTSEELEAFGESARGAKVRKGWNRGIFGVILEILHWFEWQVTVLYEMQPPIYYPKYGREELLYYLFLKFFLYGMLKAAFISRIHSH